jgi:hypothetical protein
MRGQKRNREATLFRADGVVSLAECRVFAGLLLRLRPIGLALRATPSAPTKEASVRQAKPGLSRKLKGAYP